MSTKAPRIWGIHARPGQLLAWVLAVLPFALVLGAYLIGEGLALALPNAPFAYHAEEKIARANGRGVWGFQVDSIRRR